MEKRRNIVVYWLLMIALFVSVLFSQQLVASIMQGSLSNSNYGSEATFEILWAGLVLIIILIFKNKYIFTQKRENFFSSFQYILPELLLSGFFILFSIISIIDNGNPLDIYAVFNLALYCLFIGIVEEFLCRGWLLNEFLERYSRNRKEILLSILFSSLIFGVVHFLNIGDTQGFFETLVQVMNAAAGGIFLAFVYYKTKNIWVVVASHAIWDFSLFLSQVNSIGDCLAGKPTSLSITMNIIQGIFLIFAYLVFSYWIYRQTDLYQGDASDKKDYLIGIGIAVYIISLLFIHPYGEENTSLCPDYSHKSIKDNYQVSDYYYSSYKLEYTDLVLKKDKKTGKVVLKNTLTDDYVFLTDNDKYIDYLLIDNDNYYSILIQSKYNIVYYGEYPKTIIEDTQDYLDGVKKDLKKIVVPESLHLGVVDIENDSYHHPMIRTQVGSFLYFDSDGKLYMN